MGSQYFRLKQILQEKTQCGDIVTTEDLKRWYRKAHGETAKLNLGHFTNHSKSKHDVLLYKQGRIEGTKNWRYQVAEAITKKLPDNNKHLSHYELLKKALTPHRNQELSRQEIENALHQLLDPAPIPAGLKNLSNFTDSGSNARCKDGNHLLEPKPPSRYWVHTPAEEGIHIYYHPELDILSKEHPPDAFEQDFMNLWAHRIDDTAHYADWWQKSQNKKVFRKHQREDSQGIFQDLLEENIKLSAIQVLDLLMGVDNLQGFYDGLRAQIQEQVKNPAQQETVSDAVNSVARGLYQRKRLQTPLLSLLAKGPTPEAWQNCEKLYYNRLHHTRRALEHVLNESLPTHLAAHGISALQSRPFLKAVLRWFLGTSNKQKVSPEQNWYQAGFNQRLNALEASEKTDSDKHYSDKETARIFAAIWKQREGLNDPHRFEKTLKAMLKEVYKLPGFADQPKTNVSFIYPAFYLATGLLSLLFPEAIFTLSDHSIQGLLTLLNTPQELHPAFQHIERQWLPIHDVDLRNPNPLSLIKLLHCIRFQVVPDLQNTWPTPANKQLTPRTLDMLVYTLRHYTAHDLETIRDKILPDKKEQQRKIEQELFHRKCFQ